MWERSPNTSEAIKAMMWLEVVKKENIPINGYYAVEIIPETYLVPYAGEKFGARDSDHFIRVPNELFYQILNDAVMQAKTGAP
jgi:hypothetical protein